MCVPKNSNNGKGFSFCVVRFHAPNDVRDAMREARFINRELDLGKLVTFTFRAEGQKEEKFLYNVSGM